MPRVLNKRTDKIPPDAIYAGRPGKWGNKYRIGAPHPDTGKPMTRLDVIALYRKDLENDPKRLEELKRYKGCDWWCWCAPLPCHADVLLELANPEQS